MAGNRRAMRSWKASVGTSRSGAESTIGERPQAGEWRPATPAIAKANAGGRYNGRAPTVMRLAEVILAALQTGEKPSHVAKRLGAARSGVMESTQAGA